MRKSERLETLRNVADYVITIPTILFVILYTAVSFILPEVIKLLGRESLPNELNYAIIVAVWVSVLLIVLPCVIFNNNKWNKNKLTKELREITEKLSSNINLVKGIKILKVEDYIKEIHTSIPMSQKEFIMLGGSLIKFAGCKDTLIDHVQKNDVKVRILALNVENEEIRTQYKKMLNRESISSNLDHLKELKNKKNIEIRTYEFLPTAYYFANDLNYPNGIIRVANIFYGEPYEFNYSHILVDRSETYWYEAYRKQIESLWEKGTPWL
jgi:uncharacterized membrane protein (DUF485 family)